MTRQNRFVQTGIGENMNRVIVDASVGCKWFFEENLHEKACQLLTSGKNKECILTIPEFFYLEFSNICWKRVRRGMIHSLIASRILDRALNLPLDRYPDKELAGAALENACLFGVTVYDGLYLSLAEFYTAPLITADEQLIEACRRKRFEFIEPLSELNLPGLF